MRKTFNKLLILCAISLIFTACDENAIPEVAENVVEGATFAKFFLNAEDAPSVNFFFGATKVSSVASTTAGEVQGNKYASVFPSNAYALISAGTVNIDARDLDGNVIATTNFNFEADKHYSAYLVGTVESYEIFVIEDKLPPADYVKVYWRFVNTMANIPFAVDVFAIKAAVAATDDTPEEAVQVIPLGNGLDFKQAGDYIDLPIGKYNFKVFESGTDYEVETSAPYIQNTVTLGSRGRVYSTQIRGTYQPTPTAKHIDYWRER